MKTDVILKAEDIKEDCVNGKNVIVIDAFRATTVIAYALSNGAKSVRVFREIEDTKKYAQNQEDNALLLCGERNGLSIDGFDLDNSPLKFTKQAVSGKRILMTTSNGSRAIYSCISAKNLYIAAFVNARAVMRKIKEQNEDFVIVCAGTHGAFSLEDYLCAGMLLKELAPDEEAKHTDLSIAAMLLYEKYEYDLHNALKNTRHYKYLKEIGFWADIECCLDKNVLDVVPYLEGMEIVY